MPHTSFTRRRFVAATAALSAAPMFVPSKAFGANDKVNIASIGWGMMGPGNTDNFLKFEDCRVVAVCDIADGPRAAAKKTVDDRYGSSDCAEYIDYREMLSRDDIDAVMIAVPDHWHAIISVYAAEAGKDIYGEKPLAHTFAEQQAIVAAVNANGRIWQTGSWQRSTFNFRWACELIRNGFLGKIHRVEVGLPAGHHDFAGSGEPNGFEPAPQDIRYDTWVGPSQYVPYCKARHHKNWRWSYHFGGGQLMDWIGHHNDIAHWGMDWDHTGPTEVKAVQSDFPPQHAIWNTATKYRIECKYEGDVQTIIAGGHSDIAGGTKWLGENGWVHVDRGRFTASNAEWTGKDFDRGPIKLPAPENHWRNFIDSVRSREKTLTPAEVAHRSATPGHLGLISMMTGRTIKWDPKSERILGDAGAASLLNKNFREPYTLSSAFGS